VDNENRSEQPRSRKKLWYISPSGTVEVLSPQALEADKETTDDLSEILSGDE